MARIRTVKPELFEHEELFDLELESGLPVRLAFIGLFTCCDREGRFKWRPRSLKKNVMPYDDIDFSRVLDALATRGFVRKYGVDGEEYGVIPTFSKHQVINNRESESDLPEPTETAYISTTSTREARVDDATITRHEGKGKEGNGKEGEGDNGAGAPGDDERREGSLGLVGEVLATESAKRVPSMEHQIGVVFEHWKLVMDSPKSAFDDKRKALIKKAIKMGYAVEDLCAAIDGCRKSPYHMGQNDRAAKYNGLDLILRNAEKIDQFITIGRSPRVPMLASSSAGGSKFQVAGLDHSSSVAAMERSRQQMGIDLTGPDDDDVSFDLPRRA